MTSPPVILVVDDDADLRLVMRAALRKAGYDVRLAQGGVDGLQQFRAAPANLVMLDMEMPDIDGVEVCRQLRAEYGSLLPIVMVTGMDDLRSIERAYDCGATDFVSKPVNWALIGHRVRYLLRSSDAMLDLREAEARHAAILNAIPDLLFELDEDGRCLSCHAPRDQPLPAPPEALIGRTIGEVLSSEAAAVCLEAMRAARTAGTSVGHQFELAVPQGRLWYEISVSRKDMADGVAPHYILLSRDITERKMAERRIERLAYYDSLTGLPNRRAFLDRVDREIRRAAQTAGRLAVLFMDLDGFKDINDTLGHAAGDLVLQWAAERLNEGLRPSDVVSRASAARGTAGAELELARLGGDEFTALILDIRDPADALAVAARIGDRMRQPFTLEDRTIRLTTSIGIAIYPEDGDSAAALLEHADTAMYHAKTSGRDNARLYSSSLTEQIRHRVDVENSLRAALERDEFQLAYQPALELASGRVRSLEALLRWGHPVHGQMGPARFVPLAEQNGLIERIGRWALRRACTDAARWNRDGQRVVVAVNVSPVQLRSGALVSTVAQALADSGLDAQQLELEITESAMMEDTAAVVGVLHALRELGVSIALDDFGTGYSSLVYLTRMPIGHLKIDRAFVSGLPEGGQNETIVRAIVAMASSLGLRITGEGVETTEQARALAALGCHRAQGYLVSRPVPFERVAALLGRRWTLNATPSAQAAAAEVA